VRGRERRAQRSGSGRADPRRVSPRSSYQR
jgi:hypothetical protein